MTPIELTAIVVFVVVAIGAVVMQQSRLSNPSNTAAIYTDQMTATNRLSAGRVAAKLYRQSGGEYRDLGSFDGAEAALAEVAKSFRRAGIESVAVVQNDENRFEVVRLHHSHRGRGEGKKLGGALIYRV